MYPHVRMQTILMQLKMSERENKVRVFIEISFITNLFYKIGLFSSMIKFFFVGQFRMNDTPRNDGWYEFADVLPIG